MLNVTSADITGSLSIKIKKERGGFERNDLSHCSIKWANDTIWCRTGGRIKEPRLYFARSINLKQTSEPWTAACFGSEPWTAQPVQKF